MRDGERHLLAALGVVGGRAALHVRLALLDHGDAIGWGDGHKLNGHVLLAGLLSNHFCQLQAQVHGVTHGLARCGVNVRKRHRRLAVRDDQLATGADAFQHTLGRRRAGAAQGHEAPGKSPMLNFHAVFR
ncbi:hypothetical protein D3C72_1885930 [compost metagenome]